MEEEMHWLPTSIGMTVLACIFGGIALGIYPGMEVVGNFLKTNVKLDLSNKAPDWVQAFGSIAAILSGFLLTKKTLRVQNEQQLQRDQERDRCRERIQYCILADVLGSSKAWSAEVQRKILEVNENELNREILIGNSVVASLRSFSLDQIPSAEAVRRINMAIQSASVVVANLESLKNIMYIGIVEEIDFARAQTLLRAEHLKITSAVDEEFCNAAAEKISTPEEIVKRNASSIERAKELSRVYSEKKSYRPVP